MNYDYHFLERRQTPVLQPEIFKLNTARPAVWLQKICCWTLRKLGCQHVEYLNTYQQTSIKVDTLRDLIMRQANAARIDVGEIKGVVMGPKEADCLFDECRNMLTVSLPDLQFDYYAYVNQKHGKRWRGTFRGIELYVLPWVTGCFVIPELR